MEIFGYISAHQGEFMALGAAIMAAGGIVVKLTPTKKDDEWWEQLKRVVKGR